MPRRQQRDTPPPEAVPWEEWLPTFTRSWRQGEHVSLIGPTGTGKTTLATQLLPARDWTVILGTKPVDPLLTRLRREGWSHVERWPPPYQANRVLLWPKVKTAGSSKAELRAVFSDALERMFLAGRWCVFADEVSYLVKRLGLGPVLEEYWQQGRSLRLSLVAATQRPAWVPLDIYSAPTHLFFWRTNDERDLARIGGVGGLASTQIREAVATLARHEVLYVNSRNGTMNRTQAPKR